MQIIVLGTSFAAWAVLHSLLASLKVKAAMASLLGEWGVRSYRLLYNAISVITLAPIGVLMISLPDRALYAAPAPWSLGMRGVQLLAVILTILAVWQTGALQFAGVAQLAGTSRSSALATKGFYKPVRHPLYLFGLIFLWFSPDMTLNQLVLNVAFTVYLFVGAWFEEKRLAVEFGDAYAAYKRRTPMIIPISFHSTRR